MIFKRKAFVLRSYSSVTVCTPVCNNNDQHCRCTNQVHVYSQRLRLPFDTACGTNIRHGLLHPLYDTIKQYSIHMKRGSRGGKRKTRQIKVVYNAYAKDAYPNRSCSRFSQRPLTALSPHVHQESEVPGLYIINANSIAKPHDQLRTL